MGEPKENTQDISLVEGKLALRDISLVADDLMLDVGPRPSQGQLAHQANSYTVKLFADEALVTATELLYGGISYSLESVSSLQILKLHCRRSVIQKKLTNFLAGSVATACLVICLTPWHWLVRLLGLILATGSVGYAVYSNWWLEQRRRGEFGLVVTMKLDAKVVITSHSLKAIQSLYKIMFGRLDGGNPASEPLVVNMYTGEIVSRR
ncbi:MAG: hypothetical protein ACFB2W_01120 [Leptolyngbyaceae cyanobacterium]